MTVVELADFPRQPTLPSLHLMSIGDCVPHRAEAKCSTVTEYTGKHAMSDKLLALNVPTNFLIHVDFAKNEITSEGGSRRFANDKENWALRRYIQCMAFLGEPENSNIALRLLEIECRFIALLRTVDQSVPTAPLFKKYSYLNRVVNKRLDTPSSYDYVAKSLGYEDFRDVPHSLDDFHNASTLAEKALIAELIAAKFGVALEQISDHFDYKRQKFGRGATRTYSLVYAVLALAFEFEAHNRTGHVAGVTVATDGSRHEGVFLDFVLSFVRVVDAGTIGLRATDGFNERVRKIAQKRTSDTGLVGLLDSNAIDTEVMLDFLSRADALKS